MSDIVGVLRSRESLFRYWAPRGEPTECWNWRGPKFRNGYGRFNLSRHTATTASRAAMMLEVGYIHPDTDVCHTCDNRQCVNTAHLFLGTPKDNAQDKASKGRCNSPRGLRNGSAKLTPDAVLAIRSSSISHAALARHYIVSESLIRQIRNRSIWTHV